MYGLPKRGSLKFGHNVIVLCQQSYSRVTGANTVYARIIYARTSVNSRQRLAESCQIWVKVANPSCLQNICLPLLKTSNWHTLIFFLFFFRFRRHGNKNLETLTCVLLPQIASDCFEIFPTFCINSPHSHFSDFFFFFFTFLHLTGPCGAANFKSYSSSTFHPISAKLYEDIGYHGWMQDITFLSHRPRCCMKK